VSGGLQTEFEFTLPKGYVGEDGVLHRRGTMRLATARDELEPLRDPRVSGPDDPFLTVIVLARVITQLGTLRQVTPRDIENLFAVDLAYLQDFYGVINFGSDEDIAALLAAQREAAAPSRPAGETTDAPEEPRPGGRRGVVEEVPAGER